MVRLRPMQADDVAAVVALQEPGAVRGLADVFAQDSYPFPAQEIADRWLAEIDDAELTCLVVLEDDRLVGFTGLRGDSEVLHFGVAVERWGSGVAQQAHDQTLDLLREGGCERARLWVFDGNRRGRRFYERLGWVATGAERRSDHAPYPVLLEYARDLGPSGLERLSPRQRELVGQWHPDAVVEADLSWGLVDTVVLRVRAGDRVLTVKAGGETDSHIGREITTHERWLGPWTAIGRAPVLVHGDRAARVLVATHLPGHLVLDDPAVDDPDTFRQAGRLLALLHDQAGEVDDDYERRESAKSLAWLDEPHRIAPEVEARLRDEIASWELPGAVLVPTHGDWQPRNWLIHEGIVSIIDFGRGALRPAMSDFARLEVQDFRRDASLETAFLEGYGSDPREPDAWRRTAVREAIGTAVWAFRVGDEAFEAQGHRMIADALTR